MNSTIRNVVSYILNEAMKNPDESIRDMANEAFEKYDVPLVAKLTYDDREPVEICLYQGETL